MTVGRADHCRPGAHLAENITCQVGRGQAGAGLERIWFAHGGNYMPEMGSFQHFFPENKPFLGILGDKPDTIPPEV